MVERYAKRIVILFFVGLLICAGGLLWMFKPNTRFFIKDNIELRGHLDGRSARFGTILIGDSSSPYDGGLGLFFRCDELVIDVDGVSIDSLLALADRVQSAHEPFRTDWPDDAQDLWFCRDRGAGIRVIISGGTVQRVALLGGASMRQNLKIRSAHSEDWITIPFTDPEAEALFGKPDRAFNIFVH